MSRTISRWDWRTPILISMVLLVAMVVVLSLTSGLRPLFPPTLGSQRTGAVPPRRTAPPDPPASAGGRVGPVSPDGRGE
ncbi:Uncharacterised protein [Mycobacteroides abscessus subsp. abscessus]|nr:Uncharacterised protein [Mycobacteroides abscessus subsp. abscessus]